MKYVCALTIAGSDSCGGAGIQADIKTMSALGVYAASAVTAVTAQNTKGVTAVEAVSPTLVAAQIKAVLEDLEIKAVKIGMVNNAATIRAVAAALSEFPSLKIIADPVMVATSGSTLMQDEAISEYCKMILPTATLLTPNIPETEVLSGMTVSTIDDMDKAAKVISGMGCENLLIKGGHLGGKTKTDVLYSNGIRHEIFSSESTDTPNTHGTGCTLSSAIASFIARGMALDDSIRQAK